MAEARFDIPVESVLNTVLNNAPNPPSAELSEKFKSELTAVLDVRLMRLIIESVTPPVNPLKMELTALANRLESSTETVPNAELMKEPMALLIALSAEPKGPVPLKALPWICSEDTAILPLKALIKELITAPGIPDADTRLTVLAIAELSEVTNRVKIPPALRAPAMRLPRAPKPDRAPLI